MSRKVLLAGQFHARVSEGMMDPVTAVALAIESMNIAGTQGTAVMVSCDLATIRDELRDAVRARADPKMHRGTNVEKLSVFYPFPGGV